MMLPASLQKSLDMLADIGWRLSKLESGETLPLWLRQASGQPPGASPMASAMMPAPSLSKAVLALPAAVDAAAVLAELLNDPVLGEYARRKINEANF
jgi:hypothetical protein